MNILNIAYFTGIKYFRNVIALLFFIIAPFLLLYMMSLMTSGSSTSGVVQKERVGYYSADQSEIAAQFTQLLHSEKMAELLEVTEITSVEDGIGRIKDMSLDSFIYISQDFSKRLSKDEKAEIELYCPKGTSAAKTLVDSFANSVNAASAIIKLGEMPSPVKSLDSMKVIKVNETGKVASNKDMASVSCLLIFLFYGALLGSNTIISGIHKKTNIRLACAPIKYIENFLGQLLGNGSVMLVFALFSGLAASLVFGVNLKGNILILLLITVLFLIIVNSLGILLAGLTKNIYLSGLFTFALNYLMVYPITANAFLPGKDTVYDITSSISPHYYTFHAVIGTIYKNTADVTGSIAILALMALLLCSASWLVGRRFRV